MHVTEAFGGGVATALRSYLISSSDVEHHLVRAVRIGDVGDESVDSRFSSITELPNGLGPAIRIVRKMVQELSPDAIHAHSSWAGVIVRLAVSTRNTPIIYSPHCFAFERQDFGGFQRALFWLAELALARNTFGYAACSYREARIASRLNRSARVKFVPNVSTMSSELARNGRHGNGLRVVAMGRLSQQKDPGFFASVAHLLNEHEDIKLSWIGGGPAELESLLQDAGIHVTGWSSTEEVERHMARADVYVHTARWEGFPLTILEAQNRGLPILARSIPALDFVDHHYLALDAAEMASKILKLHNSAKEVTSNLAYWKSELAENTLFAQGAALREIYRQAVN